MQTLQNRNFNILELYFHSFISSVQSQDYLNSRNIIERWSMFIYTKSNIHNVYSFLCHVVHPYTFIRVFKF